MKLTTFFNYAALALGGGGAAKLFWFHVGASLFVLTIGVTLGWALYKTRKMAS